MASLHFMVELDKFNQVLANSHYNFDYFRKKIEELYNDVAFGPNTSVRKQAHRDIIKTFKELEQYTNDFGRRVVNYFVNSIYPHLKANAADDIELVASLMKTADFCDGVGAHEVADYFDKMAEEVLNKVPAETSLSTRYCPDHIGVQTFRVYNNTYQCPLDGKIYNYENGFTDYKGHVTPGGSVANQTEFTFDFGGIPATVFDNRVSIINKQ